MAKSPMMQQYDAAKQAAGDALLLFRMGDFYELFHEDAKLAARVLQLTLTSRDKGENPVPMAGFPHHQLESYLAKLIGLGHRAAICDQVEDPRQAKGLVKRDITRIVSPGTLTDDALLDPHTHNYLAAVVEVSSDQLGLAWVELSTGQFQAMSVPESRLADELARIDPAECLVVEEKLPFPAHALAAERVTRRPAWAFGTSSAQRVLSEHFGIQGLEGFGFANQDQPALRAAGAVLQYLQETHQGPLAHIDVVTPYRSGEALQLDECTRRSLEITRTLREGHREGSLLGTIDRTVTAMGARLLAEWLAAPLTQLGPLNDRLDAVGELKQLGSKSGKLRAGLRQVYDMQRLLARVATGRTSPRDLRHLANTLGQLPPLKELLQDCQAVRLQRLEGELDLCPETRDLLNRALVDDCPLTYLEGGFIRAGYASELDELRELTQGGKQWIARYQAEEAERCGIPNIKVGFNKVFGYYLEVTHAHTDKVPPHFIRKQTIKHAERYITPELKEHEEQVLAAEDRAKQLEADLFQTLRQRVAGEGRRLQATAEVLAELDVLSALAELAREREYCRPQRSEGTELRIVDGRHPVLDIVQPQGQFVPNDTLIAPHEAELLIITGPNMAGKSTYIRQVALITLMAQIGSFVPAAEAEIGLADAIFARVGASDELARGQSTFMVEMTETARILNTATARSLVILDEIGRGTSTYDGVSLAWAIVEHLHDVVGARTLFATHYHELTELASSLSRVANWNVDVKEWDGDVVFLHRIVPGSADQSYGIHVARLAGVPASVNLRAQEILAELEDEHLDAAGRSRLAPAASRGGELQLTLFDAPEHPLLQQLRELEVNRLTPLEALTQLEAWQRELADHGSKIGK